MVMDVVVQNPQKSSGYDQGTTMRKNMWVVTPRCAASAAVSAVVLRTAGIEVGPHYHQLLVEYSMKPQDPPEEGKQTMENETKKKTKIHTSTKY